MKMVFCHMNANLHINKTEKLIKERIMDPQFQKLAICLFSQASSKGKLSQDLSDYAFQCNVSLKEISDIIDVLIIASILKRVGNGFRFVLPLNMDVVTIPKYFDFVS